MCLWRPPPSALHHGSPWKFLAITPAFARDSPLWETLPPHHRVCVGHLLALFMNIYLKDQRRDFFFFFYFKAVFHCFS